MFVIVSIAPFKAKGNRKVSFNQLFRLQLQTHFPRSDPMILITDLMSYDQVRLLIVERFHEDNFV